MTSEPTYVAVAVATPLRRIFHYRLPAGMPARPGARVRMPFGSRRMVGIITEMDARPDVEASRVKDIIAVLPDAGDVPTPILKLCTWAADYYQHPIGEVMAAALPGLLRKGESPLDPVEYLTLTDEGRETDPTALKRAPAQRRLMQLLHEAPHSRDSLNRREIRGQTIRALISKNRACWEAEEETGMAPFTLEGIHYGGITLTTEQAAILNQIDLQQNQQPVLLHGVTGSGKTEVYLRLIESTLKLGKQALVLVPEIGLTPQTVSRFQNRFDTKISVMHSGLTDRERALGWWQAKTGAAGIILGTRSAIFTPLMHPGIIIVDEEHDASYKQQDGFRYSARDLAVLRGRFEQMTIVLGSATPSLESLHNTETDRYRLLKLTERPPGVATETYELIDTRHLEVRDGFTRGLKARIETRLACGEQVLVFINRRGFAPVMICNDCRWIAHCRRCDAKLTYHLNTNTLVCHHCGSQSHNIISCQSCGGQHVSAIGVGTQRVEQTLSHLFPDFPVYRVDRDSTRRKGSLEDLLENIGKGEPAILVGTQLLAKGHHFPRVTLVAILDADSGFYSADFRAVEKLGQMLLQVGGRAGRADKPGTVLVQTAFATHPLLRQLLRQGYREFATSLLEERQRTALPPFTFQAIVRAEANQASSARDFLALLEKKTILPDSAELWGPIPAIMEKRAGRYRQMLIVAAPRRALVHQVLSELISIAESLPAARKVRWSVDVDPVDIF